MKEIIERLKSISGSSDQASVISARIDGFVEELRQQNDAPNPRDNDLKDLRSQVAKLKSDAHDANDKLSAALKRATDAEVKVVTAQAEIERLKKAAPVPVVPPPTAKPATPAPLPTAHAEGGSAPTTQK